MDTILFVSFLSNDFFINLAKENMDYIDKLVYAYLWGLEAKQGVKDKISEVA